MTNLSMQSHGREGTFSGMDAVHTIGLVHTVRAIDTVDTVDLGTGGETRRLAKDVVPARARCLPKAIQDGHSLLPRDAGV